MEKILEEAKCNFLNNEKYLSEYACKNSDAIRLYPDDEDIRSEYFHDIDRIIHSLSYTRYLDKTQVFTKAENDHVSRRITHVQLVSKIARTISRALKLNLDLIEAMALGHDIGHTPLGHEGEAMLNDISLRELGEYFGHNIQSVRHLMEVEKNGSGLNLCIQVYDGIMCHNGEMLSSKYVPQKKDLDEFMKEYKGAYHDLKESNKNRPMTLEGCIVRISDIIGYIGRDIEDAINVGILTRKDIPEEIRKVLGVTNKEIVNTIIVDIIKNSYGKNYIRMSEEVFNAIVNLKKFNMDNIYSKANSNEKMLTIENSMNKLYYKYVEDIENNNKESDIFKVFLNGMDSNYVMNNKSGRIAIDYIAGMTDEYLLEMFELNKIEVEL